MLSIAKLAAAIISIWAVTAVAAPQDLATKNNCMGCHAPDKKLIGPSYKDIAAKYKGKNAEAELVKKVKAGGTGVWGTMPMPPSPDPEGEVKQIVDWILAQ